MLKTIISYVWGEQDTGNSLEDAFEVLKEHESDASKKPQEKQPDRSVSIKRTGIITMKNKNLYKIDDKYKYISDDEQFDVGTKISFTVYTDYNIQKVANVKVVNEDWDDEHMGGEKKWCCRTEIGEVIKREGRVIYINPNDIKINLNSVISEFIPKVGDWIELEVKSEIDETVSNLFGSILEVTKISPLRTKIVKGSVQSFNDITFIGNIDKDIFFDREALSDGYLPRKGDRIITEVIESNQGLYTWRALKVILQNSHSTNTNLFDADIPKLISYENDIDGVSITDNIVVKASKFNENVYFNVDISNETTKDMTLHDIKFDSRVPQVKLVSPSLDNQINLERATKTTFKFLANPKSMGETVEVLIFIFENVNVGRSVRIILGSQNHTKQRNYKRDANKISSMRNLRSRSDFEVVRGERINVAPRFMGGRMKGYQVPNNLWEIMLRYDERNLNNKNLYHDLISQAPSLDGGLSFEKYEERFHTLLYIEEIENVIAMRKYDQDKACFVRNQEYLMLEVENLSEKRPSIIIGDKIIATNPVCQSSSFEGFVHKVTARHIFLKFSPIMHDSYNGEDYAIHAIQSRVTMRKLHHSIFLAVRNLGKDFLFPSKVNKRNHQVNFVYDKYDDIINSTDKKILDRTAFTPPRRSNKDVLEAIKNNLAKNKSPSAKENDENKSMNANENPTRNDISVLKLEWYDKSLNYFQKEAVRNILLGEARPLPYIIFGPPGTGKTVTVIESILQILRMIPHSRILVGAPSNSAADIIALRLIDSGCLKPGDLIRFVSYKSVLEDSIPTKLIPYSATGSIAREGTMAGDTVIMENGITLGCTLSVVGRHRVTVGTCAALGTLHNMGFVKGHFTHVIIDEAGQCTEPEVLIPLVFLDVHHGQAILSGDPMQLGPVITSRQANEFGLGDSYLERILNRFPYVRDVQGFPNSGGFDPRLVTRLVYNYRSLPGIIYLPNKLFYHSELRPTLTDTSIEAKFLDNLKELLPSNGSSTPCMVFHGLNSQNYQGEDSPSWFNPDEASQVFYYVNELYRLGVKSTDLGIISPYSKQVKHIREILREAEFDVPKIGTVEEFQGNEYNVIILSTVRSSYDLVKNDITHSLGFISNSKRLNVALTRAQCLCIVIGNPFLLNHDPYWRNLLIHCIESAAYMGCELKLN